MNSEARKRMQERDIELTKVTIYLLDENGLVTGQSQPIEVPKAHGYLVDGDTYISGGEFYD